MKRILFVLLPVLLLTSQSLLSASALAAQDLGPSSQAEAARFLAPLAGVHELAGDPGCERLEIALQARDRSDVEVYTVGAPGQPVAIFEIKGRTMLNVGEHVLDFVYSDPLLRVACADQQRLEATLIKDGQGALVSVHVAKRASRGCLPIIWATLFELRCHAK